MSRESEQFLLVSMGYQLSEAFDSLCRDRVELFGDFVHFSHKVLVPLCVVMPQEQKEFFILHDIRRDQPPNFLRKSW